MSKMTGATYRQTKPLAFFLAILIMIGAFQGCGDSDKCAACNGKGKTRCVSCDGRGKLFGGMTDPVCNGTGTQKCYYCNGTGKEPKRRF